MDRTRTAPGEPLILGLLLVKSWAGLYFGERAPGFSLQTPAGQPVEWKPGKVTAICFWASWCDTWKTQIHRWSQGTGGFSEKKFGGLIVSVDGRWSELSNRVGPTQFLNDLGSQVSKAFGVVRVPTTFVLDAEGRLRWKQEGIMRSDDLRAQITLALREPLPVGELTLAFEAEPKNLKDELRRRGWPYKIASGRSTTFPATREALFDKIFRLVTPGSTLLLPDRTESIEIVERLIHRGFVLKKFSIH